MSTLPGTIHLGFAKCGSTFLRACFRKHPDVHLVFKSNYFAPFDQCHFEDGDVSYDSYFEKERDRTFQIESDEHLLMPHFHPELGVRGITEQSTSIVCDRIVQVVPEAKLVLVIRNQLDMMLSTYSQYLLGGGTLNLEDFANRMINCQVNRENYFSFYYDRIIDDLQARFPGKVHLTLFEDLARDSQAEVEKLGEFLGLRPLTSNASFKDKRVGLSALGMKMVRALNQSIVWGSQRGTYQPKKCIPEKTYKFICNGIRVLEHYSVGLQYFDKRRLATPSLQQRFLDLFGESNSRLSKMLGRDLTASGYQVADYREKVFAGSDPAVRYQASGSVS